MKRNTSYGSKYLGMKFDGWTVIGRQRKKGMHAHYVFILEAPILEQFDKIRGHFRQILVVRDNDMAALLTGRKTISDIYKCKLAKWVKNENMDCYSIDYVKA